MVGAVLLVVYCILAGVYVALHWLWVMTAKTKNRASIKARAWNHHDAKKPKPAASATGIAWWIPGAQPEGRDVFIGLARQRHAEARWSNIVPHAASPRWEFS